MSMPAALRRPQKKHAPGFLEHVPCVLCRFVLLVSPLLRNNKNKLGVPNQRACGASPTPEKTRPWIFGAGILCILLIFVFWGVIFEVWNVNSPGDDQEICFWRDKLIH